MCSVFLETWSLDLDAISLYPVPLALMGSGEIAAIKLTLLHREWYSIFATPRTQSCNIPATVMGEPSKVLESPAIDFDVLVQRVVSQVVAGTFAQPRVPRLEHRWGTYERRTRVSGGRPSVCPILCSPGRPFGDLTGGRTMILVFCQQPGVLTESDSVLGLRQGRAPSVGSIGTGGIIIFTLLWLLEIIKLMLIEC
uniref:Uncharacterized protein n=1 Tax=Tetranychus urticae TaxID=32264 RepID=T1KEN1_TETUR